MPTNPKNIQKRGEDKPFTCGKNKLPYVPPRKDLLKLLAYVEDARLGMAIFIGCFQGLRIGEIVKLQWVDVDLLNGEIRVRDAKNTRRYKSGYGRDRIVPINDMFLPVWKEWRKMNYGHKWVIPGDDRFGVRASDKALIRQMQSKLSETLNRSNMLEIDFYQKNGTPRYKYHMHSFRHVCGTNLRRAGMKLDDIRDFLGHEDVETTQVYCELTRDDLREASHIAYAYPKSRIGLVQQEQPLVEVSVDKDTLKLQKEILDRQLELARLQGMSNGIIMKEVQQYGDM